VLETEGTTGTGLIAGRDIPSNEIIAVFGNVIILQERGLVQEIANLINAYNMDHPSRRFQYSIFYLVAGDSYVHAEVLVDPEAGELLYVTSTYTGQPTAQIREKI